MTPEISKLYLKACNDKTFQVEMLKDSPDNKKPRWFASDIDKHIFAAFYYGWHIAKFGGYTNVKLIKAPEAA